MRTRQISLKVYQDHWPPDDKNANFKEDVAYYSRIDPMVTLDRMSQNLDIPVGALVRYILAKWAVSGNEGLMEIGPRVISQMEGLVNKAETVGTNGARLEAYRALGQIIFWLKAPLE